MVVPLLFGLFWGAPLLAKEFEDGTHNLAWTQGVTRRRWLRTNLVWAFLAAALWGAALAALVSWWRCPENALDTRFDAFDIQGIVPVAYALFAVALGIAVGAVLRRVLPALGHHARRLRRPSACSIAHLPAAALHDARHEVCSRWRDRARAPPGSWMISSGIVGPARARPRPELLVRADLPAACQPASASASKGISGPA